jgi:tRNA-dihydrouridine synthase
MDYTKDINMKKSKDLIKNKKSFLLNQQKMLQEEITTNEYLKDVKQLSDDYFNKLNKKKDNLLTSIEKIHNHLEILLKNEKDEEKHESIRREMDKMKKELINIKNNNYS